MRHQRLLSRIVSMRGRRAYTRQRLGCAYLATFLMLHSSCTNKSLVSFLCVSSQAEIRYLKFPSDWNNSSNMPNDLSLQVIATILLISINHHSYSVTYKRTARVACTTCGRMVERISLLLGSACNTLVCNVCIVVGYFYSESTQTKPLFLPTSWFLYYHSCDSVESF